MAADARANVELSVDYHGLRRFDAEFAFGKHLTPDEAALLSRWLNSSMKRVATIGDIAVYELPKPAP